MEWNDTLELTLDGIAQGGEGVGRWQGRVVFVAGGLPGERVRVHLRERRDAYAHAVIADLLEASPDRVAERSPGSASMPWQHIAYPAQLRFKRQILVEQLAKIGGLTDVAVAETLPAARQWGYRSGARFHSDGARVGYYAAESHEIQDIDDDPLLHPALNEALAGLREALRERDAPELPFELSMRVSETYGYTVAALRGRGDLRRLAGRWRALSPGLAGVLVGHTAAAQPVRLGADHLIEEVGGVAFRLGPSTFFQVNAAAAESILRLTRAGIAPQPADRLLDLYCGAGAIGLPLAADVAEVVGVEEYAGAVADARATAELNGIPNARFVVGRAEVALDGEDEQFDAVALDPPRRGCHPRALASLLRIRPPRIVYVSCQPATLARDLKTLVGGGYRVASVQPIDLFPQTPHIESVCVLERVA